MLKSIPITKYHLNKLSIIGVQNQFLGRVLRIIVNAPLFCCKLLHAFPRQISSWKSRPRGCILCAIGFCKGGLSAFELLLNGSTRLHCH